MTILQQKSCLLNYLLVTYLYFLYIYIYCRNTAATNASDLDCLTVPYKQEYNWRRCFGDCNLKSVIDEIAALSDGAHFYRTDLHVHSFGGSPDVKDATMTPAGIVATSLSEGVSAIAVTDHNLIVNVENVIKAASGEDLAVLPAVELSTPEGHLLVYFNSFDHLAEYIGRLEIVGKGTPDSRCQTGMLDCLKRIDPTRGFAILAHVDGEGGLEERLSGYSAHKADILSEAALLAIELRAASSDISYSDHDPNQHRATIGRTRASRLGDTQALARVVFSDSHTLAALGKNSQGRKRITRVKMDHPSFEGLRLALHDADARIRLEDEIPPSFPYLMGAKLEGGFLDGQTIHFSQNLNCIIGGRGAGKSTILETVRVASDQPSSSKLIDSEAWPQVLHFVWVDETGEKHVVRRLVQQESENLQDPILGPTTFPIACYGQGEAAQASEKAQSDPSALLGYLDQFVSLSALRTENEQSRTGLLSNQAEIEKAEIEVAKIPQFTKLLSSTQQQLQVLEKANAKDVVALERRVAEERTVRETIEQRILELEANFRQPRSKQLLDQFLKIPVPQKFEIGESQYTAIRKALESFETRAKAAEGQLLLEAKSLASQIRLHLEKWKTDESKATEKIEAARKQLAAQGIKLDMAYIRKLANDEASHTKTLQTLKTWQGHLSDLKKDRIKLLRQYATVRSSITTIRTAFAVKATKKLEGTLDDLNLSIKFVPNALCPEGEKQIQEAMGWRTIQVPRAALLVEKLTVPNLLEAIAGNDPNHITKIADDNGTTPFSPSDAREIIERLGQSTNRFFLERCHVDDRPKISVTKKVTVGNQTKHVTRDFSRLSLGQQQSVLLALLLSADSIAPLVIDQPEDNLDSEFIYKSLVPVLRRAKERRQVIVVTHNANIAVLGDAEQIVVLKSTSDSGSIIARGAIDEPNTKKFTCQVLEGAEEAFRRRARIYGLPT
jgi:ABC-type cobalamin/Fe3+-siderophores transport system ATPase subunit